MVDDRLIKEIVDALEKKDLHPDEITARMLSGNSNSLSQKTALNRLNALTEKGILIKRCGVGNLGENAYRPANGKTWSDILDKI